MAKRVSILPRVTPMVRAVRGRGMRMRLLFTALLFAAMFGSASARAADSMAITVSPDRNCPTKCAKTVKICLAGGKANADCERVNRACTRACDRRR